MPTAAKTEPHPDLAFALHAFQAEAPKLLKGSEAKIKSDKGSYSYKYIALDDIMEAIQPLLTEHGLTWSTLPTRDENGKPALRYRLEHTTGGVLEDTMPLLMTGSTAQAYGSSISYARRYALTAVLNLVADEDDDGGKASEPPPPMVDRAAIREMEAASEGLSSSDIRRELGILGISANGWGQIPASRAAEVTKALAGAERTA